jgi:hypothetical protein
VSLFSCGPVWNSETLEESSWSSVELNISDSFQQGVWMEILSINMVVNVRLFMELLEIEVFNSYSDFSCFFNVEAIGDEGKVWVNESEGG